MPQVLKGLQGGGKVAGYCMNIHRFSFIVVFLCLYSVLFSICVCETKPGTLATPCSTHVALGDSVKLSEIICHDRNLIHTPVVNQR
jgi:hypothetical protein